MPRPLLGWPAFLAVALAIQGAVVWSHVRGDTRESLTGRAAFEPGGYLFGDSGLYAAAADSLVRDGDLDLLNQCQPGKATLAEALPELEGEHGGEFGLATGGYLTIKQSPVFPAIAVPFYALMGLPGLLLFNLVVLTALLAAMAQLAGGTVAARVAVLAGFVLLPLRLYIFNFSPDLFLCLLIVGSLLAARSGRPAASGVLAGLAISSKLYMAALMLPVPFVVWAGAGGCRWLALLRFALGGLVGLAPGLVFNTWLFGAPWVTGYERQLQVRDGVVGLADHSSRFTVSPLEGLRALVLHPTLGLWPGAAVWFLWPLAAALLLTHRLAPRAGRSWVLAAAGIILLNLAVFACYDGALAGSVGGNRYLFPAIVCGLAVLAAAASVVVRALRARSWGQSADSDARRGLAAGPGESGGAGAATCWRRNPV